MEVTKIKDMIAQDYIVLISQQILLFSSIRKYKKRKANLNFNIGAKKDFKTLKEEEGRKLFNPAGNHHPPNP